MSLTVTVKDHATGQEHVMEVPEDDYLLLLTGECRVAGSQLYPTTGTHVLTIKGKRAEAYGVISVPAGVQVGPLL